jgi:ribulose bisphosphate carboxylase small subunit
MATLVVRKHLSTCTVDTAPRLKRCKTKYKNPRVSSNSDRKTKTVVNNPAINPTVNPTVITTSLTHESISKLVTYIIGTGCAIGGAYIAVEERNYIRMVALDEKSHQRMEALNKRNEVDNKRSYDEIVEIRRVVNEMQIQQNKWFWQK